MSNSSVTIVIPAYNEQGNIRAAIQSVTDAVRDITADYEILVVDDGSIDNTRPHALESAKADKRVTVISNDGNKGYGYSFKRGIKMAAKEYVTIFPGDNDMASSSLRSLIESRELAEIVTSHVKANHNRSLFRRILSKMFISTLNVMFGLRMRYYNGAFICRTERVRSITIKSEGLTILAECLIRMVKSGASYDSVSFEHVGRKSDKSKALTWKSICSVISAVWIIWMDVQWSGQSKSQRYALHNR